MDIKLMVLALLATAGLAGCGCDKNDAACNAEQAAARPTTYVTSAAANALPAPSLPRRVTVDRVDVVADTLAYGGARGVYVIRDAQTGREFIGVSGVGIAETGDHQSGKMRARDER